MQCSQCVDPLQGHIGSPLNRCARRRLHRLHHAAESGTVIQLLQKGAWAFMCCPMVDKRHMARRCSCHTMGSVQA
jgi:hypothetical protein